MRNKILGAIGVLWGGGVVIYSLVTPRGGGAYGAGQMAGTVVGVLILIAGVSALATADWSGKDDDEDRPRMKKRRRRRDGPAVMAEYLGSIVADTDRSAHSKYPQDSTRHSRQSSDVVARGAQMQSTHS